MAKEKDAIKFVDGILKPYILDPFTRVGVAEDIVKKLQSKIGMIPPITYLKSLNVHDNGWEDI